MSEWLTVYCCHQPPPPHCLLPPSPEPPCECLLSSFWYDKFLVGQYASGKWGCNFNLLVLKWYQRFIHWTFFLWYCPLVMQQDHIDYWNALSFPHTYMKIKYFIGQSFQTVCINYPYWILCDFYYKPYITLKLHALHNELVLTKHKLRLSCYLTILSTPIHTPSESPSCLHVCVQCNWIYGSQVWLLYEVFMCKNICSREIRMFLSCMWHTFRDSTHVDFRNKSKEITKKLHFKCCMLWYVGILIKVHLSEYQVRHIPISVQLQIILPFKQHQHHAWRHPGSHHD